MTRASSATQQAIEAVWRIEAARLVSALAGVVSDVGLAEDLAQEALVDALTQWPPVPRNPGAWLTTVGKRKAVVDLPWWKFQGFFAWLVWMFLHLMLIVSVKNRLIIFINWAISYFTNDTTLRLILLPTRKQVELAEEHKQDVVPE